MRTSSSASRLIPAVAAATPGGGMSLALPARAAGPAPVFSPFELKRNSRRVDPSEKWSLPSPGRVTAGGTARRIA
eukprot:31422-Pelagococcus_subviridis.AAC.26